MSLGGATWQDPTAGNRQDYATSKSKSAADMPLEASQPTSVPNPGFTRGMRLADAVLLDMDGGDSPLLTGVNLVVDAAGVGVAMSPAELPRVLPWTSISTIEVGSTDTDGRPRLMVRVLTAASVYRFLVDGADPSEVASTLDRLAAGYTGRRLVRVDGGEPLAPNAARSTFERLRPLLVALTVAVVAAIVAIILAQSAGAIHLSFLGGP